MRHYWKQTIGEGPFWGRRGFFLAGVEFLKSSGVECGELEECLQVPDVVYVKWSAAKTDFIANNLIIEIKSLIIYLNYHFPLLILFLVEYLFRKWGIFVEKIYRRIWHVVVSLNTWSFSPLLKLFLQSFCCRPTESEYWRRYFSAGGKAWKHN